MLRRIRRAVLRITRMPAYVGRAHSLPLARVLIGPFPNLNCDGLCRKLPKPLCVPKCGGSERYARSAVPLAR
eukprot:4878559-Prymnesium_polylepis.1